MSGAPLSCTEARPLLLAYLDGELGAERRDAVAAHLRECELCRAALEAERQMGAMLKSDLRRHKAPAGLAARIGDALAAEPGSAAPPSLPVRMPLPARTGWRRGAALAASLLLAVGLSSGTTWWLTAPRPDAPLVEAAIDGHVRSLMAQHLVDVASSDQHTVKPWFHGRIDIAPPVVELKDDGFPLLGGRLDYLAGRPAATLVYGRRQHPINLYVVAGGPGGSAPESLARRGFNVIAWQQGGLAFWAVSDLAMPELQDFAAKYRAAAGS